MLINNNAFRTFCAQKIYALGGIRKAVKKGKAVKLILRFQDENQNLKTIINMKKLNPTFSGFTILTL